MAGGACQGKLISSPWKAQRDVYRLHWHSLEQDTELYIFFYTTRRAGPSVERWTNCSFTTTSQLVWERCWVQWASGSRLLQYGFLPVGARYAGPLRRTGKQRRSSSSWWTEASAGVTGEPGQSSKCPTPDPQPLMLLINMPFFFKHTMFVNGWYKIWDYKKRFEEKQTQEVKKKTKN